MREGLYRVQFHTQLGTWSWRGFPSSRQAPRRRFAQLLRWHYAQSGNRVTAEVTTDKHTEIPGLASVFGTDPARISLSGTVNGDSAEMTGTAAQAPGIQLPSNTHQDHRLSESRD
jgi:hypothetical protein